MPLALAVVGSAIIGAGASAYAANKNAKAVQSAVDNQKTVDIGKLVADSRINAEENLRKSLELEGKYLPGQAAVREMTTQQLLGQLGSGAQGQRDDAMSRLLGFINQGKPSSDPTYGGSALFQSAADKILGDLNLGGSLSAETQNAVVRGALSGAGRSGVIGSEAGRGLVARDLGLTSLQLQQARQNAALQAGNLQSQLGLQQVGLEQNAYSQYLQALGLGVDATTGQLSQAASLYNLGNSQVLPESGLSSTDIANVTVGQTNAYNQNLMNAAGMRAANNSAMAGGITGALQQGLGLYAGLNAGGYGSSSTGSTLAGGANIPSGFTAGATPFSDSVNLANWRVSALGG